MTSIKWGNVSRALEYYQRLGYNYLEVPWIVSDEAISVTIPKSLSAMQVSGIGDLVGSAEQSFIQMMLDNKMDAGTFVAATPCFRDERVDELHQKTFFKVELIECRKGPSEWTKASLGNMVINALNFFRGLPFGESAYICKTDAGLDIEIDGIEIGSYGVRCFDGWYWVYGTGYADPRYSVVSEKMKASLR